MKNDTSGFKHTNQLIHETSPYLLQHAHNPVNWYAWNDEALHKAKEENKLILISVGYSACHWCHVMEHESFEDEEVAQIMNENFVCIKVDREERPDIDQVYMNAVQLLSGRGGWPLNCFALPDGKPFYGGTYFQKSQWMQLLKNIAKQYREDPKKIEEYANRLTEGIRQSELISLKENDTPFSKDHLKLTVEKWQDSFDNREGGPDRAPKFPLPNNYQFLLRYGKLYNNQEVLNHVQLTLKKMAYGGIYDQIGGGFARYSTDVLWKAPHFEKMLYDNAQLVSLYAEAYQFDKQELYKNIVYETLDFVNRELTDASGAFYSALDADSEGEEGKFYVWKKDELENVLKEDFELVKDYYNINSTGLWEHGNYILLRDQADADVAKKHNITEADLQKRVAEIKKSLLKERAKRIRPGLDDKTLTSWNALMLKGYVDAYRAFDDEKFLKIALKNANFILSNQLRVDGGLNHSYKQGRSTINGYLEDYSFTIEAFISLYEVTFDEVWIERADQLMKYCMDHFFDEKSNMFFFTSNLDKELIARKMEVTDNVIPSSNSSIAKGLFRLGQYVDSSGYLKISSQMLSNIGENIPKYGSGYSNWSILMLHHLFPFYEIAVSGKEAHEIRKEFDTHYLPNKMFIGSTSDSELPLLENKYVKGETYIYVCVNKACQLPVTKVKEALKQIE